MTPEPDRIQVTSSTVSGPVVSVARTTDEVEALRPLWSSLPVSNLDADIDYFLTVVEKHPSVISPYVLSVTPAGREPMLVVARLEKHEFPVTAGYRTLLRLRLRTLVVSFDGIVGATTPEDVATCIGAVHQALRRRDADAVAFQKLEQDGALHEQVLASSTKITRVRGLDSVTRWVADVPDSMEAFLARRSTSSRQRIRTDNRKLLKKYGEVRVERLHTGDLEFMLDELEKVSSKAYQRALGVGGTNTALGRALISTCFEHRWLRAWMLYLDNEPVAFWLGSLHDGVFSIDSPAFDPAYTKDSVGMYAMYAMVEDLCADPSVRVLDFGHGDAEYKRRWSNRTSVLRDETVVASRPLPVLTAIVLSALYSARGIAYRAARDTSFGRGLRRAWRSKLTAKNSTAS
ncbi:GNAT family N-acetyltransferase [Diaminobutyricimonas sp. LJ205]|uniref:GNAT family N-acetyltransferase n=1 Tax=Diaminobutyricimonas sp. LJ205 TaxID=2683590 RepID=UPI0012F49CD1|nr:GNAT family N-acetyltransferase [Diaminobutyricimonas sp. LJ205]